MKRTRTNKALSRLGIISALLIGLSVPANAGPETATANSPQEMAYIRLVMNIFKHHLVALDVLTGGESRYSDNVVRHVSAIKHTTGLLDHVYPNGHASPSGQPWPWANKAEFVLLVDGASDATQQLDRAARKWLADGDRGDFVQAIEVMKDACRGCHKNHRGWP